MTENSWGYYYFKKGEYEKAVAAFQEAAEQHSGSPSYWRNLGHALYMSGKKQGAEKAFSRSLDLDPNQVDVRDFMQ